MGYHHCAGRSERFISKSLNYEHDPSVRLLDFVEDRDELVVSGWLDFCPRETEMGRSVVARGFIAVTARLNAALEPPGLGLFRGPVPGLARLTVGRLLDLLD